MARPIRGIIKTNQVDPTVDSASGIYTVGELTNYGIDRVVPTRVNPIIKMLKTKGGISNTWILGYENSSYGDPDFTYCFEFSTDGKNIYYSDSGRVHQWKLNTAWDLSTLKFHGQFILPDGEAYVWTAMCISDDGRYMYTHGLNLDDLVQWELSIPYDVTTATEVNRQENWTTGVITHMSISPDGTKLFTHHTTIVRTHTFSTAYDLSTISAYGSATTWTDPEGILHDGDYHCWGNNGTVFAIQGDTIHSNSVLVWTLSSAYDLSTATFSKGVHMVSDAIVNNTPGGIVFNNDGSKLIMAIKANYYGFTDFDLATNWDIESYSNTCGEDELHLGGLVIPGGLYIKPDGKRAWVSHDETDFSISTAEMVFEDSWQASTIHFTGKVEHNSKSITSSVNDFYFSTDGTKYYTIGENTDLLAQWTLSTAWDISTATYDAILDVGAYETAPEAMTFKPDGTELYVHGQTGDDVTQWSLSTAWDISTATFTATSPNDVATDTYGIEFDSDGTTLWATKNADQIVPHTLSTAWDISTMSAAGTGANIATGETTPRKMRFKPGGDAIYVVGTTRDRILRWNLSTPWDVTSIASANYDSAADGSRSLIEGLHVDSDQNYAFVCDNTIGRVLRFGTTEQGTFSSKKADYSKYQSFNTSAQTSSPSAIRLSNDGTKMYVLQQAEDLYQYNLSTPFDITTAVYDTVLDMDATDTNTYGFCWKYDGTILYSIGRGNEINWFNLSTPWDISTAVADANSGTIKLLDLNYNNIQISRDGTILYIVGETTDVVQAFNMTTPYDPSSIDWNGAILSWTTSGAQKVQGLDISPDGSKIRLLSSSNAGTHFYNNARIKTFELSTPNDLTSVNYPNSKEIRDLLGLGSTLSNSGGFITKKDKYLQPAYGSYANQIFQFGSEPNAYYNVLDSGVSDIVQNLGYNLQAPSQYQFETALSVSAQYRVGVAFATYIGDSGTKLYTLSYDGYLNQYNLTQAYNIQTAIYAQSHFIGHEFYNYNTAYGSFAYNIDYSGLDFSVDGLHIYFTKTSGDYVVHFELSSAWDISTAVYKDFLDISTIETTPYGVMISNDGTKMICIGNVAGQELSLLNLDSAYYPSSIVEDSAFHTLNTEQTPYSFITSEDKSKFGYISGGQHALLHNAFNSTAGASGIVDKTRLFHQSLWSSFTSSISWNAGGDGSNPHYLAGFLPAHTDNSYVTYSLEDQYDVQGRYWSGTMLTDTSWTNPGSAGVQYPIQLWDIQSYSGNWYQSYVASVDFTSRWRTTNATYGARVYYTTGADMNSVSNPYVTFTTLYITGFRFKSDGTKLWVTDHIGRIMQYDVPTAWDLTSITGLSSPISNSEVNYRLAYVSDRIGQIDWSDDGKLLFALYHNTTYGSHIKVYSCPQAYNIVGFTDTGIRIAPPYDMLTDTPYKLANSLRVKNNYLYVIPWDRGDGTGYRNQTIYYIDLNQTFDILRA